METIWNDKQHVNPLASLAIYGDLWEILGKPIKAFVVTKWPCPHPQCVRSNRAHDHPLTWKYCRRENGRNQLQERKLKLLPHQTKIQYFTQKFFKSFQKIVGKTYCLIYHFTGYFLEPKCVAESKVLILLICHKESKPFEFTEHIYDVMLITCPYHFKDFLGDCP